MTNRNGFTIIEVVVAIMIFSVGILGLVATAASVTRMVGRSQQYNMAASLAQQRVEILRATVCTSIASGSGTSGNYSLAWTVSNAAGSGGGKQVVIVVTSPTAKGSKTDTFTSIISCAK